MVFVLRDYIPGNKIHLPAAICNAFHVKMMAITLSTATILSTQRPHERRIIEIMARMSHKIWYKYAEIELHMRMWTLSGQMADANVDKYRTYEVDSENTLAKCKYWYISNTMYFGTGIENKIVDSENTPLI